MIKAIKSNIRILLSLVLCFILFFPAIPAAADSRRSYNLRLTVNGGSSAEVNTGDEITLQVKLERTDEGKSGSYALYAVQDEIIFDSGYFSLLESGKTVADGYSFNVRDMDGGKSKCVILSRVVGAGQPEGIETEDSLVIAEFRLKVLAGEDETVEIKSRNYKISTEDSTTTDIITSNNVSVTVSSSTVPETYTVTFKGGPDAAGTAPAMANKAAGERFTLPANPFTRPGYTFAGWNDGTETYAAGSIYTMPAHAVTFTAQWTKLPDEGSPGGGDGGGTLPGQPKPETKKPPEVPVTIEGSTATLSTEEQEIRSLLAGSTATGPVTLDLSTAAEKISSLNIPAGALQTINQVIRTPGKTDESLKIALSKGAIEFDAAALNSVSAAVKENLTIIIDEAGTLTQEQKEVVKDNPVYDIRVETDTGTVIDLNGTLTIYLPYELKPGQSPDGVVVYYVDADGNLVNMQAKYDPVTKMAYFTTTHLSIYIIDYDESAVHVCPSERYLDVNQSMWYHEAIDFVIEKGLFVGTSETTFEPNSPMSRAMLVTVLWRLEWSPSVLDAGSFEDVAYNAWYANAVAWAGANKIISGYGNRLFGPNDNITREQMAAILYRYAEHKDYNVMPAGNLNAFTDAKDVSAWALPGMKWAVGEGLIAGTAKTTLEPGGNATRAQVAMILMRFAKSFAYIDNSPEGEAK
jgi:uncharacterized repeat protein (TIGR02543 family)